MTTEPLDLVFQTGSRHAAPELHPNRLLSPVFKIVPFEGRTSELGRLDDWLALPEPVAIRVLHGPAGVGKTRLAMHWMDANRGGGLQAGFIEGPLSPELAARLAAQAPCIATIDRAERRAGLAEFLDALAACRPDRPVRVILLARHLGDWWIDLADRERPLTPLIERLSAVARLEPLSRDARHAQVAAAARAFAERQRVRVPEHIATPDDPRYELPLYLHMAALAAVLGVEVPDDDVAAALLEHEERGWIRRAGLHNAPLRKRRRWVERIRYLAAAVVLREGVESRDALHKLAATLDVHKTAELTVEDIAPHVGGFIGPLTPEPLADVLVARALEGIAHQTLEEMVHGAEDEELVSAFAALARAERAGPVEAAERMLLDTAWPARLPAAVAAVRALGDGSDLAAAIAAALREKGSLAEANALPPLSPRASLVLADAALWIAETQLVSDMGELELARAMNHYGEWLLALGRRSEALALSKEALDPLRTATLTRAELLPELARGLRNLARNLSALGQRADAAPKLEEAVQILRGLAAERPAPFRLELAAALREFAHCCSALLRFEPALAAIQESAQILRGLAESRPDLALPELAQTLCSLGRVYTREGDYEPALSATREAVDLLRQLLLVQPDAIAPLLAIGLNNLASILAYTGDHRRALRAAREAVERLERLGRVQPDPVNLARSYGVLGHVLGESPPEAAAAFAAGLRVLLPSTHGASRAIGDLRDALARDYTRACAAAALTPEAELLEMTDPG